MASSSDKEFVVYVAGLVESKSYSDMVTEITNLPKMDMELTKEEREKLASEYKNITKRLLSSIKENAKEGKKNKQEVAQLKSVCKKILYVIDNHLIPWHTGAASTVFYYKMKGDYNRVLAELSTQENCRKIFSYRSEYAYQIATKTANSELCSTNCMRLNLAVEVARFYGDFLNSPERACLIVEQALDIALSNLNTLKEERLKATISRIELLRDIQARMRTKLEEKTDVGQKQEPCSYDGIGVVDTEISRRINMTDSADGSSVRGLYNLGNTCYFNAIVQNLLAISGLRDYFCQSKESVGPVSDGFKELFLKINKGTGIRSAIKPIALLQSLRSKAPQFKRSDQQDSHELLRCLLNVLSDEESEESKSDATDCLTIVAALFRGQLTSTVTCLKCKRSSTTDEAYFDISLPIPSKNLDFLCVESCLAHFVEREMLSSEHGWKCPNCSKEQNLDLENFGGAKDATKTTLIKTAPPILTIHLELLHRDATGCFEKLNDVVSFGETIDLKPYMDPSSCDRESFTYRLLGVVVHRGRMEIGHYYAYVRRTKDNGDSVWYLISDDKVREASLGDVLRSTPYILFYEKTYN